MLDQVDKDIINAFQGGFPVAKRPFREAAEEIGIGEEEIIERIRRLDEEGYLSRFGAIIDANEIGGTATLVAMKVPEDRFEEVAEIVNGKIEVSHNYKRDHEFSMWFVVSVEDEDRVEGVLDEIEEETGLRTYNMPKTREFKLEAKFEA